MPTGLRMGPDSAAGVVIDFVRNLARLNLSDTDRAAELAVHLPGLIVSAISLAAGELPNEEGARAMGVAQVLDFMRKQCGDANLTIDEIARGCLMSRRTLYRLFEGGEFGVMGRLWAMRVDRAKAMLKTHPGRSAAATAVLAGFASERQFYRVFRATTGMTPGQFRTGLARAALP
ncbi:hypothetical protein GCM10011591_31840 [Nocardia camponoti]|uniref:HTH araC/xylS-type domain-containing protein n=1 Tax=Nocardia camponoti TaxID=1616106 RepID=A0A917VB21_9NOCA|nr:hypothetical protein GCM10011591_31840 [Nocardia camponoti]